MYDAVTYHTTNVLNVRLVYGQWFPLQLGIMLVHKGFTLKKTLNEKIFTFISYIRLYIIEY